jgi:RNA ligase
MDYIFPEGLTIEETRDVIREHNASLGVECFIEADRADHIIFNYIVAFAGSFPTPNSGDAIVDRRRAILRECRGLTFSKDGRILARKFGKFFNIGEKEETLAGAINWASPHVILEKLDGSMITPIRMGPEIRCATKMGFTDVAMFADAFVESNLNYKDFSSSIIDDNLTPIFEYCSRQNKVVLDYPIDRLVLTAVRDNMTGMYMEYTKMVRLCDFHGVECIKAIPGLVGNINEFLENTRALRGKEGYVIRFSNGHMCKAKAEEYCVIHSTKDDLNSEKKVLSLIFNGNLDDVKPFMDDVDRKRVDRFHEDVDRGVSNTARYLSETVLPLRSRYSSKKDFAVDFVNNWNDPITRPLLFSVWDGNDPVDAIKTVVAKNLGSSSRIDQIRCLFGVCWKDY